MSDATKTASERECQHAFGAETEAVASIIDPWAMNRAECDPETEEARSEALTKADAILALVSTAQAQRIAELEGEKDEALDRIEELERDAEIVSVEFEKDCWVAVRALLERVGHDDFSQGVTASDACDIIWQAIRDEQTRAEGATRAEQEARAGLEKAREALEPFADAYASTEHSGSSWLPMAKKASLGDFRNAAEVFASLNTGARSE